MATIRKRKYASQGDTERTRVGGNKKRKESERKRAGNGSFHKISSTILKKQINFYSSFSELSY